MTFNEVVIRNQTETQRNIHLTVHPFACTDGTRMMMH